MTDEAPGEIAHDWLFSKPRDENHQPRDVVLDRMIGNQRRKDQNRADLKRKAQNWAIGIGIAGGAIAIAQNVLGWI